MFPFTVSEKYGQSQGNNPAVNALEEFAKTGTGALRATSDDRHG